MPPKQNIPNVIGVPNNDDLRIMFNQIGTAIDNANANIGLLATQNQTLLNALAPHVANISNAVQNPVGLAGIEASLRHSSRPTLGPYTPERPHQWTATSLDLIRYWDEQLYLLLTDSTRTIADATTVPPAFGTNLLTQNMFGQNLCFCISMLRYRYRSKARSTTRSTSCAPTAETRCCAIPHIMLGRSSCATMSTYPHSI